MAYYTLNDQNPIPELPKRFRKEDGTTVTDLESLDSAALGALGFKAVPDIPDGGAVKWNQAIPWQAGQWEIITLDSATQNNLKGDKWLAVRLQRNEMIRLMSPKIEQYNSQVRLGITPTIDIAKIDEYIEKLRQVPQTQSDPFNIVWPDYDDGGKGD